MSKQNKQSEVRRHDEVWKLLPWYVNGTLEDAEHKAVAYHISRCQSCESEVERCQTLRSVVRTTEAAAWTPPPRHLVRLMERIDRDSRSNNIIERWGSRIREWLEKFQLAFQETPSPTRWGLAAQSMAIVLLAGAIIWQASLAPPYRTLSDPSIGPEAGGAHIRVVFTDDITERELRALLNSVKGAIVAGPSPMGVYTVAVPVSGDQPAPQTAALETLRAHPKVRLAEPAMQ